MDLFLPTLRALIGARDRDRDRDRGARGRQGGTQGGRDGGRKGGGRHKQQRPIQKQRQTRE